MNWKKLLVCCISFALVFFGEIAVNVACGPEQDPYDYYVSYFHNNVQGDAYAPFAFNEMTYLYKNEEMESEADINSAAWATYLDVQKADVFKVMYAADSATSVMLSKLSASAMVQLPDSLKQNTFIQALAKKKQALAYFVFAKQCEPLAMIEYDSWNPMPRDRAAMLNQANAALAFAAKEQDGFLKLRYAYQATRMFHYAGRYEDCMRSYMQYIEPSRQQSAVKGWALALYAGAKRYTGQPDQAAYLFAKVFASNPERRVQAYKNYFYTSASIEAVLPYAQNDAERASIWAIEGFGSASPALASLQKVNAYQPNSLLVGALLVREVNKLEQHLIRESELAKSSYASYFSRFAQAQTDEAAAKDQYYKQLLQLKDFALKLANEKRYPEPELGTVTAAYLAWMQDKPAEGEAYLAKIKQPERLSANLHDQMRVVQLLCEAAKMDAGEAFNENNLLPALKWLDQKRYAENDRLPDSAYYDTDWGNSENRFTKTTRNFYQQLLAPAYLKMGDTAKAALAMVKGDLKYKKLSHNALFKNISNQSATFWQKLLSPKTMQRLLAFKSGPAKDDVNGLLAKGLKQLSDDDFYELYGTTYLRAHAYAKALSCFNKVSAGYVYFTPSNWYSNNEDDRLYANPFIQTINDYPKKYSKKATGLNKKAFAKEMLRLQQLTRSDQKNAAQYYYKMANAVYQTGFYGNAWFLVSYDWDSYDLYSAPNSLYDQDYKLAKTARSWYNKARSLSNDPNFKAKCTFMLAKCEQKGIINRSYSRVYRYGEDYEQQQRQFMAANFNNPYFKELKGKYSATAFYKLAVGECSYLREFLQPTTPVQRVVPRVIVIDKSE